MNALTTLAFAHGEVSTTIGVVTIDGEPWWVAADVCRALGPIKTDRAIATLDPDQKGAHSVSTLGGPQTMSVISEGGLYTLILRCRDAGDGAIPLPPVGHV